jgi:hypothetical protein
MKHKRATYYGGRTPLGFWIESAFIALIALAYYRGTLGDGLLCVCSAGFFD